MHVQQVAQMYTPSVFELFQEEFDWSLSAIIKHHIENEPIHTYLVVMFNQHGEYTVTTNIVEKTIFCSCKKFETFGKGNVVYEYADLSAAQRYRYLCSKLVKLASKASECEGTYEFVWKSIDELCQKVESMCITQNKVNGDDFGAGTSLSEDKDIQKNEEVIVNVKGLRKKVGQKGRKRLKSWVEKLPKNKKVANKDRIIASQSNEEEECHSIANELFEKFKDFLNCNPQAIFDQGMDTNNQLNLHCGQAK